MNLRELVTSRKGTRTYETLSRDCGGHPSSKRLQQLATKAQKNFPDPDTVRALAKGLRVPEVRVVLAAAEDLGIDVSRATPRVLDYLPPDIGSLGERELEHLAVMVEAFMSVRKAEVFGTSGAELLYGTDLEMFDLSGVDLVVPPGQERGGDDLARRREPRKATDAPPIPEDVAAHDPQEPSQGERARADQDAGYDIDQDRGEN